MKARDKIPLEKEWNSVKDTLEYILSDYKASKNELFICETTSGMARQEAYNRFRALLKSILGSISTMKRVNLSEISPLRLLVTESPPYYDDKALTLLETKVLWQIEQLMNKYGLTDSAIETVSTSEMLT